MKKTAFIILRVEEKVKDKLVIKARVAGLTLSRYLRTMIDKWLDIKD